MVMRTSKKGYVEARTKGAAERKLKEHFGSKIAISTTRRGSKLTDSSKGYVWSARWKK